MRHALLFAAAFVLPAVVLACGARSGLSSVTSQGDLDAGGLPDALGPCGAETPRTFAYALDDVGTIYRFDPHTAEVQALGAPQCGNDNVQWTMTATSDTAYIVYTDWSVYRVDLTTLACEPTPFDATELGLASGEFGVAVTGSGTSERLYVYGVPVGASAPILAVTDTMTFTLQQIGTVSPPPPSDTFPVNLTADTVTGALYAFSPGGWVQKIDPATGAVQDAADSGVTTGSTWATIVSGGQLLLWVESSVVGYDLATRTRTAARDAGVSAVGASAFVECAP